MIELNTKDGNNLLIYSGLIPLNFASLFDKNKPKNNANEIKNPSPNVYGANI